jgi:hypothetical protein
MAEEAERSLGSICSSLSDNKLLPLLMANKNNKSPLMRSTICRMLTITYMKSKQVKAKALKKGSSENER